jgi:hypothetical protein
MITKEKLNSYISMKKEIENYADKIGRLMYEIDTQHYRIAQYFEKITIEDDMMWVTYSGHAMGYYEEDISFPTNYLNKTLDEIKEIEIKKKEERQKEHQLKKEKEEKEKELKEKKLLEELTKKYKK